MSTAEEAEAPQSRIAETAPPDATGGLDPLPPKPQRDGSALDLQAIRLAAVTATAITEHRHVTREDWPVFDEALSHLFALLGEVERLSREVTTREAAARHALDAASQARQEANRLRTDLAEAEDDRAAAYLVEVRFWDLLSRALGYLPDKILADPEQPGLDYDLGQLRHDIGVQLEAEPPATARALRERLRTAETVAEVARSVPELLGEGSFSAEAIDRVKTRLLSALAAHDQALKAGEAQ
jgi:hypothetical protein